MKTITVTAVSTQAGTGKTESQATTTVQQSQVFFPTRSMGIFFLGSLASSYCLC